MVEIVSFSSADCVSRFPEIVPWDNALLRDECVDILVCCAGFEDRSSAITADLVGVTVQSSFVILYSTNPSDNHAALEKFQAISGWGERVEIEYDRGSFLMILRRELSRWRNQKGLRIVVDLSGMASYVIYRVMRTIWEELPDCRLGIYYAEAGDYAPAREEWEGFFDTVPNPHDNLAIAESYEQHHFQSVGIDDTYESEVFPGENVGPLATEIVAIPSFSLQRTKSLIAFAETQYNVRADGVHWFLGQPPDRVRNGWRYGALAALYNVGGSGIGVSTRDYRDIFSRLDRLWGDRFTERHLVLAPLGSKMQHLGCFLFLTVHSECGLLLCEPQEFIAQRYSSGVGPRWWLDFGGLADLRTQCERRGTLEFQWH